MEYSDKKIEEIVNLFGGLAKSAEDLKNAFTPKVTAVYVILDKNDYVYGSQSIKHITDKDYMTRICVSYNSDGSDDDCKPYRVVKFTTEEIK